MTTFEQLAGAVAYIANHAESTEKPLAVVECLDDIDDRYARGSLTPSQRRRLVGILTGPGRWAGARETGRAAG